MTIKVRLITLICFAVFAVCSVGAVGLWATAQEGAALHEAVDVRLPSILGLEIINEAQTDLARASLETAIWENDYSAAAKANFVSALAAKNDAWKRIDKGWKIYEPLPQTPEEALLWKAFMADWESWKQLDLKVTAEMQKLATGLGEPAQKEAFKRFYDAFDAQRNSFIKAEASLGKVVDINIATASAAKADAEAKERQAHLVSVTVVVVAMLVMVLVGIWIYRAVIGPLSAMQKAMQEIGSSSDFRLRVEVQSDDEVGRTASAFNGLVAQMQASLKNVTERMSDVRREVGELSGAAHEVAAATAHQASAASSMAAAVEQVTVSINHVSDSAADALRISKTAEERSEAGGRTINRSVQGMVEISATVDRAAGTIQELGRQSEQISAVVQVIKDVADQTNLLALNAAIEAARAGEQGRGFAVVADEVRKLAERTTQSTGEIGRMIAAIQQSSLAAVEGMQHVVTQVNQERELTSSAGEQITGIGQDTQQVAAAISDIAEALREQSSASNDIAMHVESVAQMTEENNAATERTAESAKRVDQLADQVLTTLAVYKV
ncbi:methyl-accepting chemotaxis protein [Dechloromonas sp. TW-R-39-2]|uniref:methyl-accepting chemotaxis protein n=1 Tax=Dechloromonas sp. TW-R-39-2 TaxID=2654218 RepID=UPI00193CAB2E|nr:methyl-accepting chemotaxis protein [Dechloromonas sp. TW-R-39-2]